MFPKNESRLTKYQFVRRQGCIGSMAYVDSFTRVYHTNGVIVNGGIRNE